MPSRSQKFEIVTQSYNLALPGNVLSFFSSKNNHTCFILLGSQLKIKIKIKKIRKLEPEDQEEHFSLHSLGIHRSIFWVTISKM